MARNAAMVELGADLVLGFLLDGSLALPTV